MMKWKAKKETLNIGTMKLDNLTFNEDYMELSIDIFEISEELQTEINKSIEIAKAKHIEWWKEHYGENFERWTKDYKPQWSENPVVIQFNYLRIVLEDGKPNKYTIVTGFEDAENNKMETTAHTAVDLSEYENELKKAVISVLLDKFF